MPGLIPRLLSVVLSVLCAACAWVIAGWLFGLMLHGTPLLAAQGLTALMVLSGGGYASTRPNAPL